MDAQAAYQNLMSLRNLKHATVFVPSVRKNSTKMRIGTMLLTVTNAQKRGENACKSLASMLAKDD